MINDLFNILLDDLPFGLWISNGYGKFEFENKKFKSLDRISRSHISNIIRQQEKEVIYNNKQLLLETSINNQVFKVHILPITIENNQKSTFGVLRDITYIKDRQSEIIKQKDILETIISNIPDLISCKNTEGIYIECNELFAEKFIGKPKKDVIGKKDSDLFKNSNFIDYIIKLDNKVLETKNELCEEISYEVINKSIICLETKKAPIMNENKEIMGLVCVGRDITETKKYEEKLRKLSYTDKLTGLYNRAYFEHKLVELDNIESFPLSIIMGDINGLKIVNDALGHKEGDRFIINIFNIVKDICKDRGLAFRWGGDEIVVLLPNTTYEESVLMSEKIMKVCGDSNYDTIPYSISLGISTKNTSKVSIYNIIKEAEEKLYRQKLLKNKSTRSSIINSLKKSLDEKGIESKSHIDRINYYAMKIGLKLNLDKSKLDEISLLASLHDIGKISIPENILKKTNHLTDEERNIIKSHTEIGFRIAQAVPDLSHISRGILTHHERWDGKGYPLGLSGEKIPLISRIFSIADYYERLISNTNVNHIQLRKYIMRNSGTKFDPNIVEIFLNEII